MHVFLALALVGLCLPSAAYAQRFVDAEISGGGAAFFPGDRVLGGWYADGMKSLVPDTAVAGEVSSYYSSEREPRGRESWFDVLGGIRQRLVQRPRVTVFAQFLIGGTRYTQRFSRPANFSNSLVWVVLKPGLGVNMPLSSRWSVRLRTDVRLAAKGGEATGAWILGSGIVGRLGRP